MCGASLAIRRKYDFGADNVLSMGMHNPTTIVVDILRWFSPSLVRISLTKFVFLSAALLLSNAHRWTNSTEQQAGNTVQPAPKGWFVYPMKNVRDLDEQTRRCFNYSRNDWRVALEGNDVKIAKISRSDAEQPVLPPLLKVEPEMRGRRSVLKFSDSWLLGFDGGEFGGGLWISNADGSETKRISADNVKGMVPIGDGILVLSGLAHMTLDFGDALILSQPRGMTVALEHAIHLDGEPKAYAKDSDGSVFVVTTYNLSRIKETGELQQLVWLPGFMRFQYANSMVKADDGSIYIGMRMFVLRLLSPGYTEEWLLPDECRKFYLRQTDCVCKP